MPKRKVSGSGRQEFALGWAFIAAYVLLRMVADPFFWRSVSELYAYGFEIIFVSLAFVTFRRHIRLRAKLTAPQAGAIAAMGVAGGLIFVAAPWFEVPIPFDLSSSYTIFLLIGWAPLLEELIFRMALWESFVAAFKSERAALVATTLLFAAGHFAAYAFVPSLYRGFVLYQTAYVILLGAVAGWLRWRTGAVFPAIAAHFAFNLGFFAASRF